jgi:hypothetical protein
VWYPRRFPSTVIACLKLGGYIVAFTSKPGGLYHTQRNLHSHSLFFFPEPADFFTRWNQQSSKYPKLFNHKFPQVQIQMSKEA